MNSKLIRSKVVLGKTSVDVLVDLNRHAQKVGCEVIIGILPSESKLPDGTIAKTPTPYYRVIEASTALGSYEGMPIGFNKEDVLALIIDRAKKDV